MPDCVAPEEQACRFRQDALKRIRTPSDKLVDWDVDVYVHILQDLPPVQDGLREFRLRVAGSNETGVANASQLQFRLERFGPKPLGTSAADVTRGPDEPSDRMRSRHNDLMKNTFFQYEFVVFPHYANNHFVTYMFHRDTYCLYCLDSLPPAGGQPIRATLDLSKLLTAYGGRNVNVAALSVPRQRDGFSCGIFASLFVAYAVSFACNYVKGDAMPQNWEHDAFWRTWGSRTLPTLRVSV
eukprot:GHVU01091298.1.p1 GENE.GHVU01091298.1~~GHVU01091298.1.p1  ORF type:complete len:240 (-),score=8.98 GHVU01091298.1:94-813(-)